MPQRLRRTAAGRSWGSHVTDFRVEGHQSNYSHAHARQRSSGRAAARHPILPQLAPELDEYNSFADDLALDLEASDTKLALDNDGIDDRALKAVSETARSHTTIALITTVIETMEKVCGPLPDLELRKCIMFNLVCHSVLTASYLK